MLKRANRSDLMGQYTNSKLANAIALTTSIVMVVLTVAMIWTTFVAPRKKPARPARLTVVTSLYTCNPAITNPDFAPIPPRT
jgi:hypothetical protein